MGQIPKPDDMRPEYDFSQGVRGKYVELYRTPAPSDPWREALIETTAAMVALMDYVRAEPGVRATLTRILETNRDLLRKKPESYTCPGCGSTVTDLQEAVNAAHCEWPGVRQQWKNGDELRYTFDFIKRLGCHVEALLRAAPAVYGPR